MGGHEAGYMASRMIIDTLRQISPPPDWETLVRCTKERLQITNQQILQESAHHYHYRTIGSTVVVLLAHERRGICLWVGDSRLYRLREGTLRQLTRDHSHIQALIDQGLISIEEARDHPLSNVITRAVGSSEHLEIDMVPLTLQAGDVFMLCSDGLTKVVDDAEIAYLLAHGDSQESVQALIDLALSRGATDNVTSVVVNVKEACNETDDNGKPD
jgi:serine/threonine protein phosphatase PrpC